MSKVLLPSLCELVAPGVALTALLLLPLGPILIPRFYLIFLFVYFTFFLYTQINHVFKFFITTKKMIHNIRTWNLHQKVSTPDAFSTSSGSASPLTARERIVADENSLDDVEASLKIYEDSHYIHTFIIPNYCEPEALLRDTIKRLANHRNARQCYVILLAMEGSEAEHEQKGDNLMNYFKDSFLHFIVTVHPPNLPGESRGKGANVAYAARTGCTELLRRGVERRHIILTVSDSDSAIPELYVKEVDRALAVSEDPYMLLLTPPIFFSRNSFDVPAAVRVTDITWSAMVMSNLSNSRGLAFPCSTYSLSMVLAERVGYWDTDADSVGEDLHMWLKCFFKTDGAARSAPIFVPINLTNVQADGYLNNMYARYIQATRHYNGVADVAYTLRSSFGSSARPSSLMSLLPTADKSSMYISPYYWLDKLIVCVHVLEAHMIPATSGWLMFAAVPVMQLILFPPFSFLAVVEPDSNPILVSEFYSTLWNIVKIITVLLPFPLFATLGIYEYLHRIVDRELFRKAPAEYRTWRNVVDYISLPIAAWMFMTLPSTLACLKRLVKTEQEYIVAKKVFTEDAM
ncbi:hypothetical protein INT44_000533 [Umbelopsis vinacea]|uniref:Glycosyltransferase 2-like domain-containing protein n=1 Tax=Umbelopsis vinacea TaxID=44442 RepID=A0A8H7PKX9_9FUNG|nr:hypothetical protein INT44_000533 [Umbelopsis vinacea]